LLGLEEHEANTEGQLKWLRFYGWFGNRQTENVDSKNDSFVKKSLLIIGYLCGTIFDQSQLPKISGFPFLKSIESWISRSELDNRTHELEIAKQPKVF